MDLADQQSNLNFTSLSVRLSNEQSAQARITADLTRRVAKLEELVSTLNKPAA